MTPEDSARHTQVQLKCWLRGFLGGGLSVERLQKLSKSLLACESLLQTLRESTLEDRINFADKLDLVCRSGRLPIAFSQRLFVRKGVPSHRDEKYQALGRTR